MSDFNLEDLPPEILNQVTQEAIRLGYMPPPDGYDNEGRPCWSLEKIGAFYGHSGDSRRLLKELSETGRVGILQRRESVLSILYLAEKQKPTGC